MPVIQSISELLLQLPRGAMALIGLVILLAGARVYPFVIMAPGFALGVALVLSLPIPLEPTTLGLAAVIVGAAGAALCRSVERFAIWGIGAVITGTAALWLWPLFRPGEAPWTVSLIGGVLGLLLFPALFRWALKPVTATLGAMLITWSLGWQERPLIFAGLLAVGLVSQLGVFRGKAKKEE
jgi:hypothetical protein